MKSASGTGQEWVVVPGNERDIEAISRRCRQLVTRRAMIAAGVAVLPVPGLDWLTDVGILVKLIPEINEAFGLSPQQIERLAPERQLAVFKAASAGGSLLVGKLVSRDLIIRVLKLVGVRLTAQQAAKYVPLAGQAVSAALTFSALKLVCDMHIRQCAAVARELLLAAPQPAAATPAEDSPADGRRGAKPG
ncbi:hypothetical protein [Piscinibacter sakaiensis]|uniref:hypothetical protein n=1 Tax=Piscinibacter sakaiensis TaxID=1547922 RepID=UPI003AAA48B1